jgi:hypothetical protein
MHLVQFELGNGERRVGRGRWRVWCVKCRARPAPFANWHWPPSRQENVGPLPQQVRQPWAWAISHDYSRVAAHDLMHPAATGSSGPCASCWSVAPASLTWAAPRLATKCTNMAGDESAMTDTMRIFKWGIEGGKPAAGQAGVQPEWFYKGDGGIVIRPGQAVPVAAVFRGCRRGAGAERSVRDRSRR